LSASLDVSKKRQTWKLSFVLTLKFKVLLKKMGFLEDKHGMLFWLGVKKPFWISRHLKWYIWENQSVLAGVSRQT
jgi:hypothetical protein